MSQDLMINLAEKGEPYEIIYKPKEFSSYFKNIRELQNFLQFTKDYFVGDNPVLILGISFQVWK